MVTVQDVLHLLMTQAQEATPDSTFKFSSDSHSNREEPFGSDAPGTNLPRGNEGEQKGWTPASTSSSAKPRDEARGGSS